MTDLNYYEPLITTNEAEQTTLGLMQNAFNSAITSANSSQDTMISSYTSANASRKACYAECPQGWSTDTTTWTKEVKKDTADTSATPDEGLKDVIASCKAGCDLKWPGIVQNAAGTQGVDGGQAIGRYTDTSGKKRDITQCTDLSKFAPKVKLGGLCDDNEECESDVCVNWGGKCANSGEILIGKNGRCGLSMVRIDGSNYAWGSTWNSMCKSDVEQYGLVKWPNHTQYFKYQGVWVKLTPDWGFPSAPNIENQRLENGQYIQDVETAFKAAEAYGDYCKGFYQQEGKSGFILQSAGGANPKPSWSEFLDEMVGLNSTKVSEGFTANIQDNKSIANKSGSVGASGKFDNIQKGSKYLRATSKNYNNPTFPIAKANAAMKKTCPKGWRSIRNGKSCAIFNDDMRATKTGGWNGSSFGCNLPDTDSHYSVDCVDVPNNGFTCWVPSGTTIPKGQAACKPIKGRDIGDCLSSGGRVRETKCPVAAKMILWVHPIGQSYAWKKDDLIPILQKISTEFPDVKITSQTEMNDAVAKNLALCACGYFKTDTTKTWKNGIEHLKILSNYISNTHSGRGCGSGHKGLVSCGWTNKAGLYVTLSATKEFYEEKLAGIGLTGSVLESHQQLIEKPPPRKPSDPANNNWYTCSTGGSFATYNASTLTPAQKAHATSSWPGKNPPYYACVQGCTGSCIKKGPGVMGRVKESFVGGMKEGFTGKEGYAPLEGDMVTACQDSGTQGGVPVPGLEPTGNFLIENRKKEKTTLSKLQSMQRQVKNSINKMQSDNLSVDSLYKEKNTVLLKKLASYGQVSHKLLKAGSNLDTLSAQQSDSFLSKKSIDMSYYLWLTLAISILGIAITKIK